jgi:hypothetical protein
MISVAFYFHWFHWIEQTDFSHWMRESPSVLAFPNILFLHTLAMAFLVGTNAAVDFRLLGFAPQMRVAPMEKFFPLMWSSFWVMVVTGMMLLIAYPAKAFTNPLWYVKFVFIALALVNTRLIKTRVFRDPGLDVRPVPTNWKILAGTSLFFWAGAITAGKLLAHTYTRLYSY